MIAAIDPVFGSAGNRVPLTSAKRAIGCGCGADDVLTLPELNQYFNEVDETLNTLITAQNTQELVTITTSGLAQGGGDLTANRVIDVPKATPQEAIAGVRDDVAITPLDLKASVDDLQNRLVAGAQINLDTLIEIATSLGNDPSFSNSIYAALNNEAVLRSNADTAEAQARANADTNLQNQINTMQAQMTAMQNQINQLTALSGDVS